MVIDRDGEVGVYPSLEEAGLDLESPDVDAGEYRAFDSLGQPLALVSDEPSQTVGRLGSFEIVSSGPVDVRPTGEAPRPDELRQALLDALDRYGKVPARLRSAPLREVVEIAVQRLG
jgi:hypothetical protein